jgi:hypothetical protein
MQLVIRSDRPPVPRENPDERWHTASDLKFVLTRVADAPDAVESTPARNAARQTRLWSIAVVAAVAAVTVAAALVIAGRRALTSAASVQPPVHLLLSEAVPASTEDPWRSFAIAPDGTRIVYRIGFFTAGKLQVLALAGGAPVLLADAATNAARGATWAPDDTIIYSPATDAGLWQVPAAGGTPRLLAQPDSAKGERSVTINPSPGFSTGKPRLLFRTRSTTRYGIGRDGRFLMIENLPSSTAARPVTVVVNWFEELKAGAPAK